MSKKYKLGLVGYGHIGKSHVDAIINLSKYFELSVIFDEKIIKEGTVKIPKNVTILKTFSKKFIPENLDIIVICAPTYLHSKFTKIALSKVQNVVVEKPLSLNLKDAKEVIKIAKNNKKKIIVVKQMRMNPVFKKLKEILNNNYLDKIHYVNWNIFLNRSDKYFLDSKWKGKRKLDGGTLYNQISHYIDLLYWFFGDIKTSSGFKLIKKRNMNENSGQISLFFKKKIFVSINYSIKSYKKNLKPICTILAKNASLIINNDKIFVENSNQKIKRYLTKNKSKFLTEQKTFGKGLKVFYLNLYQFLKRDKNLMKKISSNQDVLNSYRILDKISSKMKFLNVN